MSWIINFGVLFSILFIPGIVPGLFLVFPLLGASTRNSFQLHFKISSCFTIIDKNINRNLIAILNFLLISFNFKFNHSLKNRFFAWNSQKNPNAFLFYFI